MTGESHTNDQDEWSYADGMMPDCEVKYLEKKAITERAIDNLREKGSGKIVVFVDSKRGDVGFITRIETIEINKY